MSTDMSLYNFLLKMADDRLILGHRLSEWSGHGPILEEDLALTNISLDLLGAAQELYKYAAEINSDVKDEDEIVYFRDDLEYKNLLLTEQENGDYAQTILRQFFFDTFSLFYLQELSKSKDERLKAIADKTIKETKYHWRHSSEWVIRFGDGTEESKTRLLDALANLWTYTGEMFEDDKDNISLIEQEIIPEAIKIKNIWLEKIKEIFLKAKIEMPDENAYMQTGGRSGRHTELLGYILHELQFLTRSMPDAKW
jgi:ring-1,2-phenylacetyl-CoA epoxidase subunit PaaC